MTTITADGQAEVDTTDAQDVTTASTGSTPTNAAGSVELPKDAPRFEQNMQGLLSMLQAMPRDAPVTVSTLIDWVLPLFDDARDEYHALTAETIDQMTELAEDVAVLDEQVGEQKNSPEIDEGARRVVVAAIGLAALAYKRAGWLGDDLKTNSKCPKDLAEEYERVQKFVQAWASGVDIVALMEGA